MDDHTVQDARLLNRGEEFRVTVDGTGYVGACVWSWQEASGRRPPRRVYPIVLRASSVASERLETGGVLAHDLQVRVTGCAAQALQAADPGGVYLVDDTP